MNNFDIKDCPNINNNQEEAIYETERINEFMGVLKGELECIDLKAKIINTGNHLNPIVQKFKESYDRHSEKQNDYFKKFFINCENKKTEILNLISNEITKIREYITASEANRAQSLYVMNYIYDDEFVTIINTLSSSIKEFFKSTRTSIGSIKKSSDSIVDQILGSKSSISDVFMQINSCLISKYSQSKANNAVALTKEKNIKDKLNQIVEKLESINEIRTSVGKNVKFLEQNCSKFYDQAKQIFKEMKKTRNQRLDELNNLGAFNQGAFNNIKNLNNQYNINHQNSGNLPAEFQLNNYINLKKENTDDEYNSDGFNKITGSPNRNLFNFNNFNKEFEKNKIMSNTNTNFFDPNNNKRFIGEEVFNFNNKNKGFVTGGFEVNTNRASLEDLDKEERKINDRIENLKNANSSLLNELKAMQQNFVNIKFENLCLKEKLDKFSNGNSNENEIENLNENNIYLDKKSEMINGKSTNARSYRIQENNTNYTIDPIANQESRIQLKASSVDPNLKNDFMKNNRFSFANNNNNFDSELLSETPNINLNRDHSRLNTLQNNNYNINNDDKINKMDNNQAFDNKERSNSLINPKIIRKMSNKPTNLYLNCNLNNKSINTSNNLNTVDHELPLSSQISKDNYLNTYSNINMNNHNNAGNNNKIHNRSNINTNFQSNLNFNSELSHDNNGSEANLNSNNIIEINKVLIRFKNSSEKVIDFLANMTSLQENIQKRHPKINELKVEFEVKKKELHKTSLENISYSKKLLESLKTRKNSSNLTSNREFIEENNNDAFNDSKLDENNLYSVADKKNLNNNFDHSKNISSNRKATTKNFIENKDFLPNKTLEITPTNSTNQNYQNKSFSNIPSLNTNKGTNNSTIQNSQIPRNTTKTKINSNNNTDGFSINSGSFINPERSQVLVATKNPKIKEPIKKIENKLQKSSKNSFHKSMNNLNSSTISNKSNSKIQSKDEESPIVKEKFADNVFALKMEKVKAERVEVCSGGVPKKSGNIVLEPKNTLDTHLNNELNNLDTINPDFMEEEFTINEEEIQGRTITSFKTEKAKVERTEVCSGEIKKKLTNQKNETKSEVFSKLPAELNDLETINPEIISGQNPELNMASINNEYSEKISLLEKNIKEYEAKLTELTKKLDDNSKELSLSEEMKGKLEISLKNTEEKLKEEKAKLKKFMEQLIEKDHEILKLIQYKEEVENLEKKIQLLETQIEDLKHKNSQQEKLHNQNLQNEKSIIDEKLKEKEKIIQDFSNKIDEYASNRNLSTEENKNKLESLNTELFELRTQKEKLQKLLEETQVKLSNKEIETEELNKTIKELRLEKETLKSSLDDLNKKITKLDEEKEDLVHKYTKLEDEMFNKTTELFDSHTANVEIKKEISEIKSLNNKLQNELKILKNENTDVNQNIKSLAEKNTQDLEKSQAELKISKNEIQDLNEKINALNKFNSELKISYEAKIKEFEEIINVNSVEIKNINQKFLESLIIIIKSLEDEEKLDIVENNNKSDLKEKLENPTECYLERIFKIIDTLKLESKKFKNLCENELKINSKLRSIFYQNKEWIYESDKNKSVELDSYCEKENLTYPVSQRLIEEIDKVSNNNEFTENFDNNNFDLENCITILLGNNRNFYIITQSLISKKKLLDDELNSNIEKNKKLNQEFEQVKTEYNNIQIVNENLIRDLDNLKVDFEKQEMDLLNKNSHLTMNLDENKSQITELLLCKKNLEKNSEVMQQEIKNSLNQLEMKEKEYEINLVKLSNNIKELDCIIDEKESIITKSNFLIEELKNTIEKNTKENSLLKNKITSLLENKISLEELSELGNSGENKLKNILVDYDKKIIEINDLKNELEQIESNLKLYYEEKTKLENEYQKEKSLREQTQEDIEQIQQNLEKKSIELKEANAIIGYKRVNEENLELKISKLNDMLKETEEKLEINNLDNCNKIKDINRLNDRIEQLTEELKKEKMSFECSSNELKLTINNLEKLVDKNDDLIKQNNEQIEALRKEIIELKSDNNHLQMTNKEESAKFESLVNELKLTIENNSSVINQKNKNLENYEEQILKLNSENNDFQEQIKDLQSRLENHKISHSEEIKNLNEKHEAYLNSMKEEIIKSQKGESDVLKNYYESEIKNKNEIYEEKTSKLNIEIEKLENSVNELNSENHKLINEIKIHELKLQNQANQSEGLLSKISDLEKSLSEKIQSVKEIESIQSKSDNKIKAFEKQFEENIAKLDKQNNQLEIANNKLITKEEEVMDLRKSIKELSDQCLNKEKIIKDLESKILNLLKSEELNKGEIQKNESIINNHQKLIDEKNLLINSLKEELVIKTQLHDEKIKDFEIVLNSKQQEIIDLKATNDKISESIVDLNNKCQSEKDIFIEKSNVSKENIEKLQKQIIDLKSENELNLEMLNEKYLEEINNLKQNQLKEISSIIEKNKEVIKSMLHEKEEDKLKINKLLKENEDLACNNKENLESIRINFERSEKHKLEDLMIIHEENISKLKKDYEDSEKEKLENLRNSLEALRIEEIKKLQKEIDVKIQNLKEEFNADKTNEINKLKQEHEAEQNSIIDNLRAESQKASFYRIEELEKSIQSKNLTISEHLEKINTLLKNIEELNEEKSKLFETINIKENEIYFENEKVNELEQLLENEKQITKILTDNKIPTLESEKITLKNQLLDLEKLYKQEVKNHSEEIKEKVKSMTEKEAKIDELNNELKIIRENQLKNNEDISRENDHLNKQIVELNKKIQVDLHLIESLQIKEEELKSEMNELTKKIEADKNYEESSKKSQEDLKSENKELKNKIAKLKIEFDEINNNQINEVNSHKKSSELLNNEFDKFNKEISKLLFKLQVFEDNKNFSKIKKNFESEINANSQIKNDSFEISNTNNNNSSSHISISKKIDSLNIDSDLQQINELVENKHKKIAELMKRVTDLEEEKKQIEKSLNELNNLTESKIKDYTEENKKLKFVNEEYNKKIFEAVNSRAPHLINSLEINHNTNNNCKGNGFNNNDEKDYLKSLELFKKYNEELNEINKEFEVKFTKATEKVKKYKKLYREVLSIKTNSNVNVPIEGTKAAGEIEPSTHRIILDKEINGIKWFAITFKDISDYEINHQNTFWIPSPNIQDKIESFNKFISESVKLKEIKDLYIVQEELLKKLTTKEEELLKIKQERDNLIKKQKINSNYDVNNPIFENTIPLEKYQVLLNNLIEEQEKFRTAVFQLEKLRLENEGLKNVVEQNKSKLEKAGGHSFSIIEEGGSKFLDDVNVIDEFFDIDNKDRDKERDRDRDFLNEKPIELNCHFASNPIVSHNFGANLNTNTNGNKENQTSNTVRNTHHNFEENLERKSSLNSFRTIKKNETAGPQDTVREVFAKLEDNEKLFNEQLKNVKTELKQTRNERDSYRRKYEESTTLQDGQKTELINMLKQAFEKLILEISITPKAKEYITMILKILDYDENEINKLLNKKDKDKKGGGLLSNIFHKK